MAGLQCHSMQININCTGGGWKRDTQSTSLISVEENCYYPSIHPSSNISNKTDCGAMAKFKIILRVHICIYTCRVLHFKFSITYNHLYDSSHAMALICASDLEMKSISDERLDAPVKGMQCNATAAEEEKKESLIICIFLSLGQLELYWAYSISLPNICHSFLHTQSVVVDVFWLYSEVINSWIDA